MLVLLHVYVVPRASQQPCVRKRCQSLEVHHRLTTLPLPLARTQLAVQMMTDMCCLGHLHISHADTTTTFCLATDVVPCMGADAGHNLKEARQLHCILQARRHTLDCMHALRRAGCRVAGITVSDGMHPDHSLHGTQVIRTVLNSAGCTYGKPAAHDTLTSRPKRT
jgi:hypothetical protein